MPSTLVKCTNIKPTVMESYTLTTVIFCKAILGMEGVKAREDGLSQMEATMKEISKTM